MRQARLVEAERELSKRHQEITGEGADSTRRLSYCHQRDFTATGVIERLQLEWGGLHYLIASLCNGDKDNVVECESLFLKGISLFF